MNIAEHATACRKGGMGYEAYKADCLAKGGQPLAQAEYEAQDLDLGGNGSLPGDGEQAALFRSEGGSVALDALMKAMGDYGRVVAVLDPAVARRAELEAKPTATLTKSERAELAGLWASGGTDGGGEDLAKSGSAAIEQELRDISAPLDAMAKSMDAMGERVQDGYNVVLAMGPMLKAMGAQQIEQARTIDAQWRVIKVLADRLGLVEAQPQIRKSVGNGADPRAVVDRPMGGTRGAGEPLSKAQVTQGLSILTAAARESGNDAAKRFLADAAAQHDVTGTLPPQADAAIRKALSGITN